MNRLWKLIRFAVDPSAGEGEAANALNLARDEILRDGRGVEEVLAEVLSAPADPGEVEGLRQQLERQRLQLEKAEADGAAIRVQSTRLRRRLDSKDAELEDAEAEITRLREELDAAHAARSTARGPLPPDPLGGWGTFT